MAVVLSTEFDLFGVLVSIPDHGALDLTSSSMIKADILCKIYVFWDNVGEEGYGNIVFLDGTRRPNDQLWCIG